MSRVRGKRRVSKAVVAAAAVLFLGMQFFLRPAPNPPVDPALGLDAGGHSVPPAVLATLRTACYDCHSDETTWPWYSHIAPVSWLVVRDVNEGRAQMNFSKWKTYNPFDRADMLDDVCKLASEAKMPLWQYRLVHRAANLSDPDLKALCAWTLAEADRLASGGS